MTGDSTQILADCLAAIEQQGLMLDDCLARQPDQRALLTELVPIALALRSAPAVGPSSEFRAAARQRLMNCLPPRHSRPTVRTLFNGWLTWPQARPALLLVAIIIVVTCALLGMGVVAASATSLPNDILYPVKIVIEQLRLSFAADTVSNSELHLDFAAERLHEVDQLIEMGRGQDAVVALDDFAAHIQRAALNAQAVSSAGDRTVLLTRLDDSIERSSRMLDQAEGRLPISAQPAVQYAREVLQTTRRDGGPVPRPETQPTPTPSRPPQITPTPMSTAARTPKPSATPSGLPPGVPPRILPGTPTGWPTNLPTPRWMTPMPTDWPTRLPTPRWMTPMPTDWPTRLPTPWPTHWPTRIPRPAPTHRPTLGPPSLPTLPPGIFPPTPLRPWPTPVHVR